MRSIGRASFSIYLFHIFIFQIGEYYFELNNKIFEWPWLILALGGIIVPMAISKYIEIPMQRITRTSLERLTLSLPGAANEIPVRIK
jgi:peptidoglycan/LPS O-acetylase OafA/YrhL